MDQPLAMAAFALAALAAAGVVSRQQPVVRAERLELVTPDGTRRALLGADSTGVFLTLLDARGRPVGALRLNAEPWLAVQDGGGREVAGLGAPKVHQLGER